MSTTSLSMDERYKKWEKLIYKAAMKTIGKATFKPGGTTRQSEALKDLKKEKCACKKDFENEKDYVRKGEKKQAYLNKQREVRELVEEEEKEKVKIKFDKMISEAGNNGLWGERRNLNSDETPNC